ncbi:hypothetical protein BT69DRAFT_1299137 [Atractiella rhizophila]|nr:hypothetical protein BT69DRAFT_1299137 [Atractiella rhizophila]
MAVPFDIRKHDISSTLGSTIFFSYEKEDGNTFICRRKVTGYESYSKVADLERVTVRTTASLLAHVIVGSAFEQLDMRRLKPGEILHRRSCRAKERRRCCKRRAIKIGKDSRPSSPAVNSISIVLSLKLLALFHHLTVTNCKEDGDVCSLHLSNEDIQGEEGSWTKGILFCLQLGTDPDPIFQFVVHNPHAMSSQDAFVPCNNSRSKKEWKTQDVRDAAAERIKIRSRSLHDKTEHYCFPATRLYRMRFHVALRLEVTTSGASNQFLSALRIPRTDLSMTFHFPRRRKKHLGSVASRLKFKHKLVACIQDLNQDFLSRLRIFGGVCCKFRKIALSVLEDYCAVDGFPSYAVNISYLRNITAEHSLIRWQKDASGNIILKRAPQMSPIAKLPIEHLFRIFDFLLPPVSRIQDLNQEFISRFCNLTAICSAFRNIALSILQHYCALFADNFSSYTLNISYLRNMAVEHGLMKWGKDATLTLGRPLPPSHKSWFHLLDAVAKHSGNTKVQVYNLPWDGFDLHDMLISISSLGPASLGLFFQNQQAELSLGEILSFSSYSSRSTESVAISWLTPSISGRLLAQPFSLIEDHLAHLALLQCCLCDGHFSGILDTHEPSYRLSTIRFSSFYYLFSARGFGKMLQIFQPLGLCCAFQQLSDSAKGNTVSRLRRPLDDELRKWFSEQDYSSTLYLDGGMEDSNLISESFLEAEARWDNLQELVLLYCHFSASGLRQFLGTVQKLLPYRLNQRLVVQLKLFFGDCDFSTPWFSKALGNFHNSVAVSSVELFNERYYGDTKYPLQYDPSRSGKVFSMFCRLGYLQVDIWFIDQDDESGNESSLFFWENFEANRRSKP